MKTLILLLLCSYLCFAGTPGHETIVVRSIQLIALLFSHPHPHPLRNLNSYLSKLPSDSFIFSLTQHCDLGCIEVQTSDYIAHDICERLYIKIQPDASDNLYRLTVFSGYPLWKADKRRTRPAYKQVYVWEKDYYRVSLDARNCLRVAREWIFSPSRVNVSSRLVGWLKWKAEMNAFETALGLIALGIIGQCPPSPYRDEDLIRNPYYYVYGPGKTEGLNWISPPAFEFGDDDSSDSDTSTLIPSQDITSSLFSFGDGDLEAGDDSFLSSPSENMIPLNEDSLFSIDGGLSDISFVPSDISSDLFDT